MPVPAFPRPDLFLEVCDERVFGRQRGVGGGDGGPVALYGGLQQGLLVRHVPSHEVPAHSNGQRRNHGGQSLHYIYIHCVQELTA